jgi:phosphatidylglycerol:prolipoprotein diacylglycerol transferase
LIEVERHQKWVSIGSLVPLAYPLEQYYHTGRVISKSLEWELFMPHWAIADLINWGWLRIGPPYIYININPVIFQIGPLAVRWYGLMYVVGILAGLQVIAGYIARKGISEEALYRTLWWCIAAGLLGGRLYFVIQQHNLVQDYLQKPWRILATWEGGMAFYGAIFLVIPTLYWRARVERLNPLVLIDAGVLFATVGQIFGRIGNLINGDIIGYTSTLPWSTVYVNLNSWACSPYVALPTCGTPVQPAAGYELISNLILLVGMLYLARRVTRPGVLMLVYLFSYNILQFFLFFVRDNSIETPFGLNWGLKQAQWTALVFFIVLFPITYWVLRSSKPVPAGKIAATYGIPQRFKKQYQQDSLIGNEAIADVEPDPSSEPDASPTSDNGASIESDSSSESDSSAASDDTQAEPDPSLVSDETQVEPNSSLVPDNTQAEPELADKTPIQIRITNQKKKSRFRTQF